jgi:post-segregation antitoxin (ccd killing protein)
MRMARVNIYLPDELAAAARDQGLNVSAVARSALEGELASRSMTAWLADVARMNATWAGEHPRLTHEQVLAAIDAGRDEMGDIDPLARP